MHPTICTIGPFTIYSYGVMLVAAFLLASFLASRRAHVIGVQPEIIYNLTFYGLLGGIVGARLFFVAEHAHFYLYNPLLIVKLQEGGLSWFGGLFSGALVACLYLRRQRIRFLPAADLLAPYVALGHAVGRIGCFLNGCCGGRESPYGIYFPVHEAFLIPTQLYSFFALVCIYAVLRLLQERDHREGQVFFFYLLLYSLFRFVIEFWRGEHPVVFLGLTLFQFISLAAIGVSLFKLIGSRQR